MFIRNMFHFYDAEIWATYFPLKLPFDNYQWIEILYRRTHLEHFFGGFVFVQCMQF